MENSIEKDLTSFANLPALLQGKLGYALGNFPYREKFSLVNVSDTPHVSLFNDEALLRHLRQLDFILIDAEAAYLSELPFVLNQMPQSLVNQGLIIVFDRQGIAKQTLWHRILTSGEVEFLSESTFAGNESLYLFQWIRPRASAAALPKPLRYRIADRVSGWFNAFPGFKRWLKNMFRSFSGTEIKVES